MLEKKQLVKSNLKWQTEMSKIQQENFNIKKQLRQHEQSEGDELIINMNAELSDRANKPTETFLQGIN